MRLDQDLTVPDEFGVDRLEGSKELRRLDGIMAVGLHSLVA